MIEEPVTPDTIVQVGMAFWGSKTLLSAVELRLFGVLSGGFVGRRRSPRAARAASAGWMADAGFSESYVEFLIGPESMVVGIK